MTDALAHSIAIFLCIMEGSVDQNGEFEQQHEVQSDAALTLCGSSRAADRQDGMQPRGWWFVEIVAAAAFSPRDFTLESDQ